MDKITKKIVKSYNKELHKNLFEVFTETAAPKIIESIMEDYDERLTGVADPKSKLAPEYFMDEFRRRLERFDFVKETIDGVRLMLPDMENFNFSGRLRPLQNILEGVSGRYVEVSGADYRRASGKQTYKGKYIRKELTYLFTQQVAVVWERMLKKKFDTYPFSNTPPIDLFARAQIFAEDNIDDWINKSITDTNRGLKR